VYKAMASTATNVHLACGGASPMSRLCQRLSTLSIIVILGVGGVDVDISGAEQRATTKAIATSTSKPALWRNPGNVKSLDLFYGPGSKERAPKGPFTFVKELTGGATLKFEVVDQRGRHWIAKLGEEANSEIAASRLVWAAGYFTDEAYHMSEVRLPNMPQTIRDSDSELKDGVLRNVRLEMILEEQKNLGEWSWSENPFVGTRELNGLRIMMALINNWDLKKANNAIYSVGGSTRYAVSDLGGSFGKTGGVGSRTKSDLKDYAESKFIDKEEADVVDLKIKSRPFFLLAVDPYHYNKLASREKVGREIPRDDARWLGRLLSQLSTQQLRDCFRAAGYSPNEASGFALVVQRRIAALTRL
jgi:hypothetical protein